MSYENDGAAPSDENERVRLRCVDIDQNAGDCWSPPPLDVHPSEDALSSGLRGEFRHGQTSHRWMRAA